MDLCAAEVNFLAIDKMFCPGQKVSCPGQYIFVWDKIELAWDKINFVRADGMGIRSPSVCLFFELHQDAIPEKNTFLMQKKKIEN